MPSLINARTLLSASMALTVLSGCSNSLLTSAIGKVATSRTAGTAPFVGNAAAAMQLNSTTEVTSATQAKALSTYDESLMEAASASLEASEASANYSLASLDEMGNFGGGFGGFGQNPPRPANNQAGNAPGPDANANANADTNAQAGPGGPDMHGGMDGRAQGGQGAFPGGDRMGGQQQMGGQGRMQAGGRGFNAGAFGGGDFDDAQLPCPPRIEHHAAPPAPRRDMDDRGKQNLQDRRKQGQNNQQQFARQNTQASADEQMIGQVLNAQSWQVNAADKTTVSKTGTNTLTLGNGTSRKIAVLRVVDAAAPHALVQAQTDIADVYSDKATKTVHWEKTLQADGSYSEAFHEEYVDTKGTKWVSDWTKTLAANGNLTGSGTWTETDATGKVVSQQALQIGGSDAAGQTISASTDASSATTATTSTTSTDAAATGQADAAATAAAATTPIAATANTDVTVPEDKASSN